MRPLEAGRTRARVWSLPVTQPKPSLLRKRLFLCPIITLMLCCVGKCYTYSQPCNNHPHQKCRPINHRFIVGSRPFTRETDRLMVSRSHQFPPVWNTNSQVAAAALCYQTVKGCCKDDRTINYATRGYVAEPPPPFFPPMPRKT